VPRKVFVAGEILTAADVNTNLMDQAVMSFAGTAARGSAIPSPVEGMVAYVADQDLVQIYDGSNWKNSLGVTGGILQVVSTVKTDAFTTTSGTFVDITGLSVSITPTSSSSKILVLVNATISNSASEVTQIQLVRDSTNIFLGTSGTTRNSTTQTVGESNNINSHTPIFLDSPNTTSATTYKLRMAVGGNTGTLNRRGGTTTDGAASSITVLEVAA